MVNFKLITFALLLTGCTLICATENLSATDLNKNDQTAIAGDASIDIERHKTTPSTPAPTSTLPTSSSSSSSTTSTLAPESTSTSTTPAPTTTTPTTPAPTTTTSTTPAPTTTTTSTTSAPTTSSTTAAPVTTPAPITTTVAPITTPSPKPKPYPEPSIGQWNSTCIMVKMAVQLNITYATKDKTTRTAVYNVPANATVNDSHCADVIQNIQMNWGPAEAQQSMVLQFDLKNKSAHLTMLRFVIAIVGDEFPNAAENQTIQLLNRDIHIAAPLNMSYHCTRPQQFNLTETILDKEAVGNVIIRDVQVEAFRMPNKSGSFSEAHDCDAADTPDIVPIAVGIALVAMIMIILVSYLCARRRSASRGYMSF